MPPSVLVWDAEAPDGLQRVDLGETSRSQMTCRIVTMMRIDRMQGTTTSRKRLTAPRPSSCAASSTSWGSPVSPA